MSFFTTLFYGNDKQQKDAAGVKLKMDKAKYNFGVAGHTKQGKSTLINVILGVDMAATGAAQTTDRITKYDITLIPDSSMWDLPGSGTYLFKPDTYFEKETLYAFDTLIIVTQETIGIDEMKYAAESLKRKQPVIFVRSKCDQALKNDKEFGIIDEINQKAADKFVADMHIKFEKEMRESKIENLDTIKLFFISSLVLRKQKMGEIPECVFEEKLFLRELNQAAAVKRGK